MSFSVSLVITSCGRLDLLEQTIKSFFQFNTKSIDKTLIIEDSGKKLDYSKIVPYIKSPYEIVVNTTNIGQIKSIDKIYSKVNTEYIFHCEDDWEFFKPEFIEKSHMILQTNNKIFTVWLRSHHEKKIKKLLNYDNKVSLGKRDFYYILQKKESKPWQNGFTLNPGLRRTADCMIHHPYGELKEIFPKMQESMISERDLAVYYGESGFYGAITSDEQGYVRHIGGKRHILLPWE
jgi:hypothetical protein